MLRFLIPAAGAGLAALTLQACAPGEMMEPDMSVEAAETLAEYDFTGETRSCLSANRIDEIKPLDERHWLVETVGGDMYLNRVSRGCNGADRSFTYLQYEIPTGQLCRGEIVRVIDNGSNMSQGACGLGDYERLTTIE
ncbi:MAG: hypothetical protein RIA71_11660 [Oceanicaulis sp.]